MKKIILTVVLLSVFGLTSTSSAEQMGKYTQPALQNTKVLQQPLVGSVSLQPALKYNQFISAVDELTNRYNIWKLVAKPSNESNYIQIWESNKNKVKQCLNNSYSVQDQQAAGCSGNDTVDQCMAKLYKKCVANIYPAVGLHFRESSERLFEQNDNVEKLLQQIKQ